jgi:hypothetical protein
MRGPLAGTLYHFSGADTTSAAPHRRHFVQAFEIALVSQTVQLGRTALLILFLFFQVTWIVEFTRPNSQRTPAFCFPFSVSCIALNCPSTLRAFLVFPL